MITRLFVYGTLMLDQPNHGRLGSAEFDGPIRTAPLFTLVSLGGFPAMLGGGTTAILGELYGVDDLTLLGCDRLEGHPSFYRRARVPLVNGEQVYAYLLVSPAAAAPRIPSGSWREYIARRGEGEL